MIPVHAARLSAELGNGTPLRGHGVAAAALGPLAAAVIHSDAVILCPSATGSGHGLPSSVLPPLLFELLRDKVECGGAWLAILADRCPLWARLQSMNPTPQAVAVSVSCSWLTGSRRRWRIASSITEVGSLESACAHVHVKSETEVQYLDPEHVSSPPQGMLVAVAAAVTSWAADRMLCELITIVAAKAETLGCRREEPLQDGLEVASLVQAGCRPIWRGTTVAWRATPLTMRESPPAVFVGQGSATFRASRTIWSSPFVVGRDGEHQACRRWYAERLIEDEEALARTADLAGRELVCECDIGFPCHADALAVAALGMVKGGHSLARELLSHVRSGGNWPSIPPRPRQRWPQEGLQQAVKAIIPSQLRDVPFPFIEDIVNAAPFVNYLQWREQEGDAWWVEQAPSWNYIRTPAWQRTLEGRQDGAFLSKVATRPLVSFDLDKREHLHAAQEVVADRGFPLDNATGFDADLRFAAEATIRDRATLRKARESASTAIKHLALRLRPLAAALRDIQPSSVQAVAGDMNLALVAVLIVVLHWPDKRLVLEYVAGFNVMGEVQASGVYPVNPKQAGRVPADLLEGSQAFIDNLVGTMRRTRGSEFLVSECLKDEERRFGGPLVTREQLDAKWGRDN